MTRAALAAGSAVLAGSALFATVGTAGAATPASFTNCSGTVSPDTGGTANVLDYKLKCGQPITAFTVVVDQFASAKFGGSIDNFANAPSVLLADGKTPSPTATISCAGTTPGNGINCNTGTTGLTLPGNNIVEGTLDLTAPFCKHLPVDSSGKTIDTPGTLAVPKASAWLVVTDSTGAQDGPFVLRYRGTCAKVPNVVPPPKSTKPKTKSTKSKSKSKSSKPKAKAQAHHHSGAQS